MPKAKIHIGQVGVLGKLTKINELTREEYVALRQKNITVNNDAVLCKFYRSIIKNEIIYSTFYKNQIENSLKRTNYNVLLHDTEIFEISYFLNINDNDRINTYIIGYYFE